MSAGTIGPVKVAGAAGASRAIVVTLAVAAVLWLLLFRAEAAAAVTVWLQSTAFGHCFLVIPIAAWLAWERRRAIAATRARPLPWAALLMLPPAVVWLLAERLGFMEGRQLMAVTMLQVLVFAVLGWRLYRALTAPLLYLFFLVPFGGFLVAPLQTFTARFVGFGLDVLGVPNLVTQYLIEIPEGTFRVAEACAGLRFLIAAIAFGALYACLIYRTPWKRVVFIGVSIVVPIIANGFRALGIVELGHLLGSAEAAAVDHVLYGWLFFSVVILLLILAGLPFREDRLPIEPDRESNRSEASRPPVNALATSLAAACALMLAAAGPAAAGLLDRVAAQPIAAQAVEALLRAAVSPEGCAEQAGSPNIRRFRCGAITLSLRAQVFPPRAAPGEPLTAAHAALQGADSDEAEHASLRAGDAGPVWAAVATAQPQPRGAAATLYLGGRFSTGLAARLAQAGASLGGPASSPVLLSLDATGEAGAAAEMLPALQTFVAAQAALYAKISGR